MKLRNKKTGEIKDFALVVANGSVDDITLTELNEEWEDVPEEPKEYWYIDADGEVLCEPSDDRCDFDNKCRGIGNYFETQEEAEKAVRKLKAWKRLKDKGFRFGHWVTVRENKCGKVEFKCDDIRLTFDEAQKFYDDVTLLFGGEE